MKKKIAMAVAVMAAVLMLTGCGMSSGENGDTGLKQNLTESLTDDGSTASGSAGAISDNDQGTVTESATDSETVSGTDSVESNAGPSSYGIHHDETDDNDVVGTDSYEAGDYDFPGKYGDVDGDRILSSLTIDDNGDATYSVEMSIFRLSTFDGTAIRTGSNTLHYTDLDIEFEGDISFTPGGSATFTTTRSDWEYIMVGDQFEFTDKL